MNITLLSNRDLASNLALNRLLPELAREHRVQVFLSSRVGSAASVPAELAQLGFFEQSLFTDIIFPLLDSADDSLGLRSFAQLALYTQTPITELNAINSEQGLATVAATEPDLVLSIRYGGILREPAIAIAKRGVINLHSGLLPHYRGVMATFWAMLNGEQQLGTTLHYINDGRIDCGNIIGTTSQPVVAGQSYLCQLLSLYPAALDLLLATVAQLAAGQAVASRPQPEGGKYYSFPAEQDLLEFKRQGFRLYDVDQITNLAQQFTGISR